MRIEELTLWPEEAFNDQLFPEILYQKLGIKNDGSVYIHPVKRSIDARGKKPCVRFQVEILSAQEKPPLSFFNFAQDVSKKHPVLIVGCGPAGLFAALRLI